jgi:hypothetical protein
MENLAATEYSDSLTRLSSISPLVSSLDILSKCSTRYRDALRVCPVNEQARRAISERFSSLSLYDQIYLLRLPGFRAAIDAELMGQTDPIRWAAWVCSPIDDVAAGHHRLRGDERLDLCPDYPLICSIWNPDTSRSDGAPIRHLFSEHMQDSIGAFRCVPSQMSDSEVDNVDLSLMKLACIHDGIIPDIVYNVRYIVKVDYEDHRNVPPSGYREIGQSVSTHSIPSSIFLSPYVLSSVEACAESLYHEGLHKKLSNTLMAFDIIKPGISWTSLPSVHSHWNVDLEWNRNIWEFDRALYAAHIYVHLVALYRYVIRFKRFELFSQGWCENRLKECGSRRNHLMNWINQNESVFSSDGLSLVAIWNEVSS